MRPRLVAPGSYVLAFEDLGERVPDQRRPGVVEVPAGSTRISLGDLRLTRGSARNVVSPAVRGTVRVGETVRADTGTWKPSAGLDLELAWVVDGRTVGTVPSLALHPAYAGEALVLKVRAGNQVWAAATATSDRYLVQRARTRLEATGPAGEVRRGRPVPLQVHVGDPTGGPIRGTLTVTAGERRVASHRVDSADGRPGPRRGPGEGTPLSGVARVSAAPPRRTGRARRPAWPAPAA